MRGEDVLAVTKRQLNNMMKVSQNRKDVRVTMSPTHLKYNLTMDGLDGGFLGMLASF